MGVVGVWVMRVGAGDREYDVVVRVGYVHHAGCCDGPLAVLDHMRSLCCSTWFVAACCHRIVCVI